jgi:glycerate 2-kinase
MKVPPNKLSTFSISHHSEGDKISRILAAALDAVDPYEAVLRFLHLDGNIFEVNHRYYDLTKIAHLYLVGAGKASLPMSDAVYQIFGDWISAGCVITKQGYSQSTALSPQKIQVIEAGHPLPDSRGVLGSLEINRLIRNAQPDDLIICVISGGGSALLTAPRLGISLEDVQLLTSQLLACGATIDEINTIRKHIDLEKGGGLVAQAGPAQWITLILSDILGDPLDRIASGPTVPDESTFQDAFDILSTYGLIDSIPGSISTLIQSGIRGEIPETLKPGNQVLSNVNNLIVANNTLAATKAIEAASQDGFNTMLLTNFLQGEASQAGKFLASIAQQIHHFNTPIQIPACLVAGGETTVTLHGNGLGGRNQELALGAAEAIFGLENTLLVTLATDGGDGPTEAAGAVVTGFTLERCKKLGMRPREFLNNNDSFHFFKALDDLLVPGPTLTNVGDLTFLFSF